MTNKDLYIFDFDGTLVNTSNAIKNSVSYILKEYNLHSLEPLEKWIGPPIEESFMKFCRLSENLSKQYALEMRQYYNAYELYNCEIYPGILDLLWDLKTKHKLLAIASNKRLYMINQILLHFHLDVFFDFVAAMTDKEANKSKTDLINDCLNHFSMKAKDAIMIGDTELDAKGAAEAKVKFYGVTWGIGYSQDKTSDYKVVFVDYPSEII